MPAAIVLPGIVIKVAAPAAFKLVFINVLLDESGSVCLRGMFKLMQAIFN